MYREYNVLAIWTTLIAASYEIRACSDSDLNYALLWEENADKKTKTNNFEKGVAAVISFKDQNHIQTLSVIIKMRIAQ
jgi:predicted oxidoreductase (fatty acid repression mutant protein)